MTAKNRNTLAGMLEELNFAYTDVYTGKAQTGEINAQVSLTEVYSKLSTEMKSHIYTVDGTSTISLVNSNQSSITLLNDAEAIGSTGTAGQNTVTVEINEERESTSYYLEADGMYYPMCIRNFKIELDETNATTTQPTGAGSLGSGIEISFIDDGETEEKGESNFITASKNGTIITLTAKSNANGTTQVVVRDGDVTLTGNIVVTVNPTYTISLVTMTDGSVSITTNNIDTTSNTKYGKDVDIILTAVGTTTPTKYIFEKWNDESTTNPRSITVSSTTAGTYTAIFKEKPKPYGAKVQLNGGNAIAVKGSNTIDDNWKLFYVDDDDNDPSTTEYVHLIYGDYYPANVQTEITIDNAIFAPAHIYNSNTKKYDTDSECAWSVNSAKNRLTLLQYLKNNASYAEANLDTSIPEGSYESWTNLATALTGNGKALNGKTLKIQGAPNITMWIDSWNEQGYTELALDDTGNKVTGYNIRLATENVNSNSNYSINLSVGYNDRLYFPNVGRSSTTQEPYANKARGYWLASLGGSDNVCSVWNLATTIYCKGHSDYYNLSARPLISIIKSDFQELFPNISITKPTNN